MMPWVAGVDGVKAGWLAVLAPSEGGRLEAALASRWADLSPAEAISLESSAMSSSRSQSLPGPGLNTGGW